MIKARYRKRDGRTVYDVKLRDPNGKHYTRTFEPRRRRSTSKPPSGWTRPGACGPTSAWGG